MINLLNDYIMNMTTQKKLLSGMMGLSLLCLYGQAISHGDVSPQPVDTEGLEELGEEWREVNPYRGNAKAAEIGKSAYNQNCARCHGLGAVSGGIAPDLRALPWGEEGDVFYVQRVRDGAIRNGVTYMPKFEGIVSQEGLWTIRAWLDTVNDNKPDDFKLDGEISSNESADEPASEETAAAGVPVGERKGEDIVKKTCAACHISGVANAPKIDETGKESWQARYANGLDSMVAIVKTGKGGMPPMGADPTLTDDELKRAIVHMLGLAGIEAED